MGVFDRSLIGTGTIGNMVLVGYTADFCSHIWRDICHIPVSLPLGIRIEKMLLLQKHLRIMIVFIQDVLSGLNMNRCIMPEIHVC